ncbi:MAG: hypothetical protein QME96_02610 [Myxococcota bacterium]|nr:hypothetical protein [Myxococcota bacterium]
MTSMPPVRTTRAAAWAIGRSPLLGAAFLLAAGCRAAGTPGPAPWDCSDYGSGRRCASPVASPPGVGWDCYASGGALACVRRGTAAGAAGWTCVVHGGSTVCVMPGGATPPEPSPDGWQCRVERPGRRVCEWRRAGNDPWICVPGRCVERHPDRPSADEWDCIERHGSVLCRGRFVDGVHPRWRCVRIGDRHVCRDLDPDYPGASGKGAWTCSHDSSSGMGRSCTEIEPGAGEACPGLVLDGRCFPAVPDPTCYFDRECVPPSGSPGERR